VLGENPDLTVSLYPYLLLRLTNYGKSHSRHQQLCFAWTYDTTALDGYRQERPKTFIRSRNAFFQISFKSTKHGKRGCTRILCLHQLFAEDEQLRNIISTVSQSLHKESCPRIHQRNTTEGFEHTSPPKRNPGKRPRKAD